WLHPRNPARAVRVTVDERWRLRELFVCLHNRPVDGTGDGSDPLAAFERCNTLAFFNRLGRLFQRGGDEFAREILRDIGDADGYGAVRFGSHPHVLFDPIINVFGEIAVVDDCHVNSKVPNQPNVPNLTWARVARLAFLLLD